MYKDVYLKAPSKEDFINELIPLTHETEEGEIKLSQSGEGFALDYVGQIEGVNGVHLNLRLSDHSLLDDITLSAVEVLPEPSTPYRVWF